MDTLDPTAQAAADRLRTARQLDSRFTATAPPVLISFGILCAVASASVLGLHLTQESTEMRIGVIITLLAWVGVAIAVPFMFPQPFPRGLGRRWVVYMLAWAVLWSVGTVLADTDLSVLVLLVSAFLLVLFMMGAAHEAQVAKRSRDAARSAAAGE